jgi:hypothetical protein
MQNKPLPYHPKLGETVSFSRLSAYWQGKTPEGKRNYLSIHISGVELGRIRQGTLAALGLAHLWNPH